MDTSNMLAQGTLLRNGTYRVEGSISSGGFGNTYLVVNTAFNERYAMKEFFMRGVNLRGSQQEVTVSVPDNHASFEGQMAKFKKEAQRLRKLHNDHIVRVHDLFEENGTVYYIMDLIDGESISTTMKREKKPMAENKVMNLLPQILDALSVVHGQEPPLLHLDIKPGNIMVDRQGRLYLIDFGASKQLHDTNAEMQATSSALAYTPGYAPMEQVEQAMDKFGPWTDFYALGATLYYMLTCQQPPSFTSLSESESFQFPSSVSARTKELVKWMMKPHRKDRPQSVADINRWLRGDDDEEATQLSGGKKLAPAASTEDEATQLNIPRGGNVNTPRNNPSTDEIDGGATQLRGGTTTPKVEEPKKKSSAMTWVIIALLALAGLGAGAYFMFFAESQALKDAKADLARYQELVEKAEEYIEDSDSYDYEELSKVGPVLDRIEKMEDEHSDVMPDEYDRSEELKKNLKDKTKEVADDLAQRANDANNWRDTYRLYEESYKLLEKESTKEKMDHAAYMLNYMYVYDIKFGNVDSSGTLIDAAGTTLYAGKVKYLKPYIYYRGLSDSRPNAKLQLKYIRPNGSLITGSSSPEGYSTTEDKTVENYNYNEERAQSSPMSILGWGNEEYQTYQTAGTYTFELWCDGIFIFRKTVELH